MVVSNVPNSFLLSDSLKIHDTKFTVMSGVEHNISLLFSNVSKRIIVNKNIWYQKEIYNAFGFSIFKKPHSVFKPKSYGFYNRNVGIFSGNDIIMEGYYIKMHRYLRMRKVLIGTISSE